MNKLNRVSLPPAVILAGGLGKRLRAAYATGPKSMAPIGKTPFLHYLLTWLHAEGIADIVLCVGYKRAQIQKYVGNGRKWGVRVSYSIERVLLGTAGAVKRAEHLINDDCLFVLNGDTLLDVNLKKLAEFHRTHDAQVTMAAIKVPSQDRYGTLKLNRKGKILKFVEKGVELSRRSIGQGPINGGVYIFQRKLLKGIQIRKPVSLEKQVFPHLAAKGLAYAYLTSGYFLDIGVPEDFRRAQRELPKRFAISHSR